MSEDYGPLSCKHGHLAHSCEICQLERDLAAMTAERNALKRILEVPSGCSHAGNIYAHCLACEVEHLRDHGYILAMRLLQQDSIVLDSTELAARDVFLPRRARGGVMSKSQSIYNDGEWDKIVQNLRAEVERLRALLVDWNDHAHGIGSKSQQMLVVETDAALGEG